MKNIIADSIWAHMFLFAAMVCINLATLKTNPLFFVVAGVIYFSMVMRSAMAIADFEMSVQGEVLKHMGEHRGKIDSVIINRRK